MGLLVQDSLKTKPLSRWFMGLVVLLLVSTALIYAYCWVFSEFRSYDDEGYLMISVEGFLKGQPLYDAVYSQYGPFYYDYEWLAHKAFGLPVSHDVTGALCVLHWVVAAGLLALAGGWMMRSAFAGLFVFMQAAVHLNSLPNEPGHPQELIALLLALGAVSAGVERRRWPCLTLGALAAALAFTKINVGAFFVLGLLTALICCAQFSQAHRAWFRGTLIASVLIPLVLMRHQLSAGWVAIFAFQACCALVTAELTAYSFAGEPRRGRSTILLAAMSFAATSFVLLVIVLATGTSISGLVEGLIRTPARLASVYTLPSSFYSLPSRAIPALASGASSFATALAVVGWRERLDRYRLHLGLLKGAYGLLGALVFAADMRAQFAWLWPWVWLAIVPIRSQRTGPEGDNFPRILICLLAVWQGLQAFPVAGTQVYVATFLSVLVYTFCLQDSLVVFAEQARVKTWLTGLAPRTAALLQILLLTACVGLFALNWCNPFAAWRYYAEMEPLQLRGASRMRLPHYQADELRELSAYLQLHGDTFFSFPGVNSLYFWTGKRPPTWFNAGDWMVLLSDRQQEEILAALKHAAHPLVVVDETGVRYWERGSLGQQKPLVQFIRNECHEIQRIGTFHILTKNS
jgi:hypothetical protein